MHLAEARMQICRSALGCAEAHALPARNEIVAQAHCFVPECCEEITNAIDLEYVAGRTEECGLHKCTFTENHVARVPPLQRYEEAELLWHRQQTMGRLN